jgi:hypothetical protein
MIQRARILVDANTADRANDGPLTIRPKCHSGTEALDEAERVSLNKLRRVDLPNVRWRDEMTGLRPATRIGWRHGYKCVVLDPKPRIVGENYTIPKNS